MALPVRVERGHTADPLEIARLDFNNMLGRFFGRGLFDEDGGSNPLANFGVDVREDADHIYIEADLPGFRKEDVNISLEDNVLTIVAERKEEIPPPGEQAQQAQQGQQAAQAQPGQQGQQLPQSQPVQQGKKRSSSDYLLRERRYERFVRSFILPHPVDEQSVQAKLENGVLKITLNKREDAKPRRIQVA
jgi:HSP20 family protein